MDKQWDPEAIRRLLDESVNLIDQSTLLRLRGARLQALKQYDARGATLPLLSSLLSWAGVRLNIDWHASAHHRKLYRWISALLLVASLFSGVAYWQQMMVEDPDDVDIAILTDDLPIEYYAN
ncbi:MAG: DUF3619 family protein [Gallionella sp.]